MNEIVLFGDSAAQGIVLDENGQYKVSRSGCVRLLKRKGYPIRNYAVHGYTVLKGLESFRSLALEPGSVCLIEFGGNDCDLDWDAVSAHPEVFHDGKVPIASFRIQLSRFAAEARTRNLTPVFVTPLPIMSDRFYRWVCKNRNAENILHYLRDDVESISRWQERYAIAVREIAAAEGCPLVDVRNFMLNQLDYPLLMCEDGIHPNEAGHAVLAELIDAHCQERIRRIC